MTLDNLQYALYLNNCILLDKIKVIKDAVNGITSTDIEELKKLVDYINNSGLTNIKQLITDLDTDLSNHTSDTVIHVTQDDKDLWNATLQNAKDYAKKLFDSVTSFTIEIVDTLPTENIKTMTIYFMRNEHDNESDYYEEYMYINDKWEIIGNTFINLAQYLLKADFEKYQQEIADKFAKYNTSDEIANILKDYLLTQTFNDTIKNYVTTQTFDDTIKNYTTTEALQKLLEEYAKTEDIHTHENKDIIDKLSESADGNLLFDGQEIKGGSSSNITISEEDNNAIQQKDDGIFVEDKTEQIDNIQTQVNRVSIAQKTVNELGEVSLLSDPVSFTLKNASKNGTAVFLTINKDFTLDDDITKYDSIKFKYTIITSTRRRIPQITEIKVKDIVYNQSDTYNDSDGSIFYMMCNVGTVTNTVGGAIHTGMLGWFKDTKTIRIYGVYNAWTSNFNNFTILDIIGIKNKSITIDPVEYINTTQGIEDTPVGHIISHIGNTAPKHYLICDGTEYNISDYPYLAQHFMDEFGSYNCFGGDGTNTFAVPDHEIEYKSIVPVMSSNEQNGYVVSASSEYSDTFMAWKAFNKTVVDAEDCWASAAGTTTGWIQIQLPNPLSACAFSISSRNHNYCKDIVDFELLGSNDGENWDTLHSITEEPVWNARETRTYYFNNKQSYLYYRLNITKIRMVISADTYVSIGEFDLFTAGQIDCIKYEPTYFMTVGEYTVQGFEDYSEEEKIIGRWIDGKPIYRKVVKLLEDITVKDSKWVDMKIDATNVERVIYGCIQNSYSVQHYGIWVNPSTNTFNIISSRSDEIIYKKYDIDKSIIILEYTKTTDEENSFTPDMLSTIVMSGNKQEDLTEKELNNLITDTINLLNE